MVCHLHRVQSTGALVCAYALHTQLLQSMRDQARPGAQQLQWNMEPVELALQYKDFLEGLFKPLEDQEPGSELWQDGEWIERERMLK